MRPIRFLFVVLLLFGCAVACAQDSDVSVPNEQAPIEWLKGPFRAKLGDMGTIPVPGKYLFADAINTRKVLTALKLRVTGSEIAMIRPADATEDWFVVFDFADDGFVQDDEAGSLDETQILNVLRQINEEENLEHKRVGWQPTKILGWEQPPSYDPATNYLTWALRVERDGLIDVNVNTRALGRHGIMIVNLVVEPVELPRVLPIYRAMIDQFDYREGHRYSEFREGDKVAKYGLSALVTGTAAAALIKAGLLRRLITPLIAGFLALTAAVKRWFGGHKRITPTPIPMPSSTPSEKPPGDDD